MVCVGDTTGKTVTVGIVGVIFVIVAQLLQAVQYVVEQRFGCDVALPSLALVGTYGFWSTMWLVLIVPLLAVTPACVGTSCAFNRLYHTEIPWALNAMGSHHELLILSMSLVAAVVLANACGVGAARSLTEAQRVLEAGRTLLVLGVDLALYHLAGDKTPRIQRETSAERWTRWSLLQMIGFLVLIVGAAVYNVLVKLPFLWYPNKWTLGEFKGTETLAPEAAVDPLWRRSDKRDADAIRKGFYMRIGVGAPAPPMARKKSVTFLPGYEVITEDDRGIQ